MSCFKVKKKPIFTHMDIHKCHSVRLKLQNLYNVKKNYAEWNWTPKRQFDF